MKSSLVIFTLALLAVYVNSCDVPEGGDKYKELIGTCVEKFGKDSPCKLKCMCEGLAKVLGGGKVDMEKAKQAAAKFPDGPFKTMIVEIVACKTANGPLGDPTDDCKEFVPLQVCVDAAIKKSCPAFA